VFRAGSAAEVNDIFYAGLSGYAGDRERSTDPALGQGVRADEHAVDGEFTVDAGVDSVGAVELQAGLGHRSDDGARGGAAAAGLRPLQLCVGLVGYGEETVHGGVCASFYAD